MYINNLLDAYKKAKNYVQDKQIAHDLNMMPNKISKMRSGLRYVSDEEAVFLAKGAGIDPEIALLGCHADRNENPNIKMMWENIAKKYNKLGLQGLSMAYVGFIVAKDGNLDNIIMYSKYELSGLMLKVNKINHLLRDNKPFNYKGLLNELPRND